MPKKKNASKADKKPMDRLPLLPLRDMVVFPRMVVPLMVGRPTSLAAVEACLAEECPLFLCSQRDAAVENLKSYEDVYEVGVASNILQSTRMPDGSLKIVVECLGRGWMHDMVQREDYWEAFVTPVESNPKESKEHTALLRTVVNLFEEYARNSQRVSPDIVLSMRNIDDGDVLVDLIAAYLPIRNDERQSLLNEFDVSTRLEVLSQFLLRENEMMGIEQKVRERVRDHVEKSQREFYLHEQLKAIHQELGNRDEGTDEYGELREQIAKAKMPKDVREKAEKELGRFERMPAMSPESAVLRTYIEWLCELPWAKRTRDALDIVKAAEVLDADHYGLEKVKERILEFLSVRKLSKNLKGPILCLVGPPGVGKTSLGKSIANAMGRKFVRVSLGGVRDEAEIRGHRRTYIGSLPGRIVQSLKKVGVRNPVFMLDEIDKMNSDFRGDPASALLEVLDPEQNRNFSDHYLEVDFDLHEVFFITTANSEYEIPYALHDRMEIVRLSGYTALEKEKIAELFLVPRQLESSGLSEANVVFKAEGLKYLIDRYTREAGVRELERRIAQVCRKVARKVVTSKAKRKAKVVVNMATVRDLLGPEEYSELRVEKKAQVGVATGLAWTMVGGEILQIETSLMPGKGDLTLTGQLGDVMKESGQAAYTYLRANKKALGITGDFNKNKDIHVHLPEGAIPKDGPSAGVTLAVSMLSALRNKAPKAGIAMTGEITLLGRVLQVGGIKEKVLAAHRAGIRKVILPEDNRKDLVEIPADVRNEITFVHVSEVGQVFDQVFGKARRSTRK